MNRARYPDNWDEIAHAIKTETNWTCEECGRPCRRPGETKAQLQARIESLPQWKGDLFDEQWDDIHGQTKIPKLGRFTLTVAHLDHNPPNCTRENLRAWCSVCHCRYDITREAMARKLQLKLEYEGQQRIPGL